MAIRRLDDATPLAFDSKIQVVELSNGLRIWHQPLARTSRGFAVALQVEVGALHENDSELGIAHFLEHLAFQGGGSALSLRLRQDLEKRGASLGRGLNASTSLESTSYVFSSPSSSLILFRRCLAGLAEIASSLSFEPSLVELERKVILEEIRQYAGAQRRTRERALQLLVSSDRLSQRHPLGTETSVGSIEMEQILAFHRRWYQPQRSTLLIVGNLDHNRALQHAADAFATWAPALPTLAPPRALCFEVSNKVDVLVDSRPTEISGQSESEKGEFRFYSLTSSPRPSTFGEYRRRLTQEAGTWLFNRRLSALLAQGAATFEYAGLRKDQLDGECALSLLKTRFPVAHWREALGQVRSIVLRLEDQGFLQAELEDVQRKLELRASNRGGRLSCEAALQNLQEAAHSLRPPMSRVQFSRILKEAARFLDLADLNQAFRDLMPIGQALIAVFPPGQSNTPQKDELMALRSSPPTAEFATAWADPKVNFRPREIAPGKRGPSGQGEIVSEIRSAVPELVTWQLGNGVRVHFMPRVFPIRRLHLELNLGGGKVYEKAGTLGITSAATLPFLYPQMTADSTLEIQRLMESNDLHYRAQLLEDAVNFQASAPHGAEEALFELIHHLLDEVKTTDQAFERWRLSSRTFTGKTTVAESAALQAMDLLSTGDPRFRPATAQEIDDLLQDDAAAWLETLRRGPIQAAIVGHIESARLRSLVGRYLGTLTQRPVETPLRPELLSLPNWLGPVESRTTVDSGEGLAALLHGWRGPAWKEWDARLHLRVLAKLAQKRMFRTIREDEGLVYNLSCNFSPSRAYPGAALFAASLITKADGLERCHGLLLEVFEKIRRQGFKKTEIFPALRYFAAQARRALDDPRFWTMILADYHSRGRNPQDWLRAPKRFLAVSSADLDEALDRFLSESRMLIASSRSPL